MTEVSVGLSDGRIAAIVATGHSGFAEKGEDVVCAAVSALLQALAYGFERVLFSENFICTIQEEEARMMLDWRRSPPGNETVLVQTVVGSLKEIERIYPDYVRIVEVLVDDMEF